MRTRSLIGPLLLILLGALLLMNTLRPDLPLFDILASYWPFLLIAWGLLRLLEIVVWRIRSRPLPPSGIGGGEWTAIVFICLIGSGLYAANQFRPWQRLGVFTSKRLEVFGRTYDYSIPEQQKPAGKAPRVLVENLRGNTRIVGADAQEIKVGGRKTIRALQESDADQANKQSAVEVSLTGEQVVVRTNQDRVTGEHRVSTDLEVTLPRGASLEARGREGDFEVLDLDGTLEITSDNAGVRVQNVAGSVRINVRRSDLIRAANVKGSVEISSGRGRDLELENIQDAVTVEGFYSGDLQFTSLAKPLRFQNPQTTLRVEKLPGQIRMDLGDFSGARLIGPVRFTTSRARDVQIDGFTNGLELSIGGGDVTLRPAQTPLAAIQVETRSGNIELALPESSQFELRARTGRGDVYNDFGPALKEEREGKLGASLSGAVGQGPLLSLSTSRGSLTVRKDTGAGLPLPKKKGRADIDIVTEGGRIRVQKH